jgi:catechol 2,3-dioxygenase-like lactoylglutathione lyase family enzyme
MTAPMLRVARPSNDIDALMRFYRDGLGLKVLYEFEDHDDFAGVMLGHEGAPYHFEFTTKLGHVVGRAPTKNNLIVFYYPDAEQWQNAVQQMRKAGFAPVRSFNPYWDRSGLTFEDSDGYRVVLQNERWAP